MLKRRLIRALFILPVLLGIAAWLVSTGYEVKIFHGNPRCGNCCILVHGGILVERFTTEIPASHRSPANPPRFWQSEIAPTEFELLNPELFTMTKSSFLGFSYKREAGEIGGALCTLQIACAPIWPVLPLFSTLLFLVWRKTTPRKLAQGFPVEPGAPHA